MIKDILTSMINLEEKRTMKRRELMMGSAALLLAGCGGGSDEGATITPKPNILRQRRTPAPTPAPTPTVLTSSQVVLTDNQLVPNARWNDPCVLLESGGLTMYASCGNGFTGDISIYRLRSTDGLNWALSPSTPVLTRGPVGSIDARAVETPSVTWFNGQYHMFYTGYPLDQNDTKSYRILHATSSNGVNWTRDPYFVGAPTDPNNPNPTMDFRQWVVAEPGVVAIDGTMYLYFSAIGADAATQQAMQTIGITTTTDGVNWTYPVQALRPDQSVYPRSVFYGYSTPAACLRNGQMALFFSVVQASPWGQVGIANAVSPNAFNSWTLNTMPVISRDAAWCSAEVLAPSPLVDIMGTHLWYAGNDGTHLSIAYRQIT